MVFTPFLTLGNLKSYLALRLILKDDPNEYQYFYELELCGMTLKNAKVFPRELTEEEKAEIEAAKNTKQK